MFSFRIHGTCVSTGARFVTRTFTAERYSTTTSCRSTGWSTRSTSGHTETRQFLVPRLDFCKIKEVNNGVIFSGSVKFVNQPSTGLDPQCRDTSSNTASLFTSMKESLEDPAKLLPRHLHRAIRRLSL